VLVRGERKGIGGGGLARWWEAIGLGLKKLAMFVYSFERGRRAARRVEGEVGSGKWEVGRKIKGKGRKVKGMGRNGYIKKDISLLLLSYITIAGTVDVPTDSSLLYAVY